jgi:RNA polymerase sigma-70 factor (ECF subfamily)
MQNHTVDGVLREHGAEIFGWMLATLGTEAEAADAFSLFSEDLWRSLDRHQGRCSIRTWCYMIARHAVARAFEARARGRAASLSEVPASRLVAPLREPTLRHLRTDVKDGVRALRERLDLDDQTLLVLRVDKDLGWRDIALVMLGADADDASLARHAATLRKRFERIKERLRQLAAELPEVRDARRSSPSGRF